MIGTIARSYAYTRAPRTMFALRHPRAAAKLRFIPWDLRHGYGPRIAAVGAAMLALPVGYAIGRLTSRG